MNKDKSKTFFSRHISSSDGLYQGNGKDFILQPVFINKIKNVVSVLKFLDLRDGHKYSSG